MSPTTSQSEIMSAGGFWSTNDDGVPTQKAFFPSGFMILLLKLFLTGWAISCFILIMVHSMYPRFEMAYLTTWSLMVTIFYLGLSFLGSVAATCSCSWVGMDNHPPQSKSLRTYAMRALTISFSIAAVQEIVVMAYWLNPQPDSGLYWIKMAHGPLAIVVLIDGLVLNAMPVTAKNIIFTWIFECLYLIWTLIYSLLDLKNPFVLLYGGTDGGIYVGMMNWRLYPGKTCLITLCFVCIITPIIFAFVWGLSRLLRRCRQLSPEESTSSPARYSKLESSNEEDSGLTLSQRFAGCSETDMI